MNSSNQNNLIVRIDRNESIRAGKKTKSKSFFCFLHFFSLFLQIKATLVENTKVEPKYASDLMVLAEQIQKADQCVKSNVTNKLSLIADQIM